MNLDRVVLQFSLGQGVGSAVIRWFGHDGSWSHVDLVLPDGRLLGARADNPGGYGRGVQIRPANYQSFARRLVVAVPTQTAAAVYGYARAQIGKAYDHTAIVAFFVERNWRDPDAWFCSELAAAALIEGGFWPRPWALPCPVNKIDPDDLLLLISPYLEVIS